MNLDHYRSGEGPIPQTMRSWHLFGAGMQNFGRDDAPIIEDIPSTGADELLARVDAVGICASDAKMIQLGNEYPLFRGRDLAADPARMGHELALTVARVGDRLKDRYQVGQRLGLQPDVYYQSRRSAIGMILPGGMSEYMELGAEILQGDGGAYVLPVTDALSYADVALSEPWACVDAAYRPFRRTKPLPGGLLWISGNSDWFDLDFDLEARLVIASDLSEKTKAQLRVRAENIVWANGLTAEQVAQDYGDGGIDDIILLQPAADQVIAAQRALTRRGTLKIGARGAIGKVEIDISRIHYDFIAIMGTAQPSLATAYSAERNRSELARKGTLLIHGGGGPMGQMHLQRALTIPEGPSVIIVTNRGQERLRACEERYASLAARRGIHLIMLSPRESPGRLEALVDELGGCDDILMMFPDLAETERLPALLKAGGVINLFAGLPPGNAIAVDIDRLIGAGCQIIGTSGSSLADQARVLEKATVGQIAPARIVSAVGALDAAKDAVHAVNERRYSGKIVLYPALAGLPLTSIVALGERFPAVRRSLGANGSWTKAAEEALFREFLD